MNVASGTYSGVVTIDKALTLKGAQAGIDARGRTASESIIQAQSGNVSQSAISIKASDVTIDGFEIEGAGTAGLQTWGINAAAGTSTSNIHITNTIFRNLYEGLHVQGPATNVSNNMTVDKNAFFDDVGDSYKQDAGIWMASAPSNNLTIADNNFSGHDGGNNGDYAAVNVDGSTNLTITGNSSQKDGSFLVLVNNTNVTVSGNNSTDQSGSTIYLGLGNNGVTIKGNSLDGGYRGVKLATDFGTGLNQNIKVLNNAITNMSNVGVLVTSGSVSDEVFVNGNQIVGDSLGVSNENASTTVDATNNYWGTSSSTEIAGKIYGGVDYTPWSGGLQTETTVDADAPEILIGTDATSSTSTVNVPEDATSTTLNASALLDTTDHSVTLPGAITVNATTSVGNVNVQIPAGIKITGTSGWTGVINVPQVKSNGSVSVVADPNHAATVSSVIEVGYGDVPLTFDQAVRILIAGQAGSYVGYSRGGTFTAITNTCSADTQAAGNALSAGGNCKIDVGSDLVIWTKHFTSFVTYSQVVTSVTTYASGGGGGYVAPLPVTTAPVTTVTQPATAPTVPAGQVLGASAFRFTNDLELGAQGDAVTELQNRLTSEGVYSGPVTGYFGQLTLAGVKSYQAKYNLPTTGFVGPMTRAELNAALTAGPGEGQVLGASTTGMAETASRIQGIIQTLQAQGGQEKIISVLQMVLSFLQQ